VSTPQQQAFTFARAAGEVAGAPRRRNKVIEAGAGTGKTTAIVGEVLDLLLGDADVHPERIVLVTFTEKAAGEIADRIEAALNEIHGQLERGDEVRWPARSDHPLFTIPEKQRDACRAAVERQLARIDSLRSQTIHSFCQTLLRQYPIEAGVDPQFRVIEGFDRSLLYGQIYDAWIDDETRLRPHASAAREWESLLEHYGYLFQARAAIFTIVDKRHILLDRKYDIGSIAEYEPALREALATYSRYVRVADPPPQGSSIDLWIDYFAPMAATLRKTQLRGIDDRLKACLQVLRGEKTGTCVYDLLISHRAAAALLSLATRFVARLDEEKRTRGVLDFDDLLIRTRMLLDNAAALDRIRKQYDYIFVDEFQDTDRVQVEIFDRLARDRFGALVPGKTTVVGDPKQSIYGFRRADPETYGRFTEVLAPKKDLLTDQYRSTPELVRALNAIGPPLFTEKDPDPNVFQPAYHALRAAKDVAGDGSPPLVLIGCDGDPEAEAEAIVAWIRKQNESDLRKFALLFRRKTKMEAYLDVFDKHNLLYVVPPMGLFLERPAAVDLLAMLRAVAYRYDRGANISAARSPYFALTDAEITNGILSDGAEWKAFEKSLEGFREIARHATVTELIDQIISTTGIEAVYHQIRDGARLRKQLEQVRAIAFIYDQKAGGSVRQFVEEIARRREVPEEVEPSLLDETTNAVRVLTIHGAKGLEFDTVILPDIEFQSKASDGIDLFTVEEPPSLVMRNGVDTLSGVCRFSDNRPLRDIGGLRDKAEMRRLFYVAITRAKSKVAIVCDSADKVHNNGFGKYLCEIFDVNSLHWPEEPGVVTADLPIGISIALEKVAPLDSMKTAATRLKNENLEAELAAGAIVACEPPLPETPELLPRADAAIAKNALANRGAGILLHRVLERWDGTSDIAPLLDALSVELAADPRAIELVRRRLAVVSASAVFGRIAKAETIGREMPIAFLDDAGAIAQKRIDRLIREADADTVIDYKSGAPDPSRLERDQEQVRGYARAIAKMTGRQCQGLLWYIDTENDVAVDVM
jgi:ATP-dependent helicase/nuclease subunit A